MENLGSFGRKITKNVVEHVIKFNDLQKTNFVWCYMNSAFQTNKTSSKVRTDGTVEWTWRMTLYLLCSKSRVSLLLFIFGGKCNYFRYVICLSKSEYDRVKTENQKKTCQYQELWMMLIKVLQVSLQRRIAFVMILIGTPLL